MDWYLEHSAFAFQLPFVFSIQTEHISVTMQLGFSSSRSLHPGLPVWSILEISNTKKSHPSLLARWGGTHVGQSIISIRQKKKVWTGLLQAWDGHRYKIAFYFCEGIAFYLLIAVAMLRGFKQIWQMLYEQIESASVPSVTSSKLKKTSSFPPRTSPQAAQARVGLWSSTNVFVFLMRCALRCQPVNDPSDEQSSVPGV